jgi:hypothetical protein
MDLGFTLDATLQQYEPITEPAIVLQSVIECLNLNHHVQKCFEFANRAIPHIVDPLLISKRAVANHSRMLNIRIGKINKRSNILFKIKPCIRFDFWITFWFLIVYSLQISKESKIIS